MQIQDRIVELRRVPGRDLVPNPKNWRTHPEDQQNALRGVLAEIGFAGAALARQLDDGRLMLIDGHLRAETTPDNPVPVLVLDVTEEEADLLLATFDPIGAMAGKDDEKLRDLLDQIEAENPATQALLDSLSETIELPGEDQEIVEDDIPEPPPDPITQPGDLWLFGAYWVCEDCGRQYSYEEGQAMEQVCPCDVATQ